MDMPLFQGPLYPLAIICVLGMMFNVLLIAQSRIIRKQAGPVRIDLGQTGLGKTWELSIALLFAVPIVLLFFQGTADPVEAARLDLTTEELWWRIFLSQLLPVAVPHGLFIASIGAAHLLGVRPGRRELAEQGLIYGGWQLLRWEDLTQYRWEEGTPATLTMEFGKRNRVAAIPPQLTGEVDTFLRSRLHMASEAPAAT